MFKEIKSFLYKTYFNVQVIFLPTVRPGPGGPRRPRLTETTPAPFLSIRQLFNRLEADTGPGRGRGEERGRRAERDSRAEVGRDIYAVTGAGGGLLLLTLLLSIILVSRCVVHSTENMIKLPDNLPGTGGRCWKGGTAQPSDTTASTLAPASTRCSLKLLFATTISGGYTYLQSAKR